METPDENHMIRKEKLKSGLFQRQQIGGLLAELCVTFSPHI